MAVLERSELQASPLADLHAIADQLGLDGFRRLRKAELIDAILGGGGSKPGEPEERDESEETQAATSRMILRREEGRSASGRFRRRAGRSSAARSRRSTGASKEAAETPAEQG